MAGWYSDVSIFVVFLCVLLFHQSQALPLNHHFYDMNEWMNEARCWLLAVLCTIVWFIGLKLGDVDLGDADQFNTRPTTNCYTLVHLLRATVQINNEWMNEKFSPFCIFTFLTHIRYADTVCCLRRTLSRSFIFCLLFSLFLKIHPGSAQDWIESFHL